MDQRQLRRMNGRLSEKAVGPIQLQLPAQAQRPRIARRLAVILPNRSGHDIVVRKHVQDIHQNVPHDANVIDRLPDAPAQAKAVAEVVSAHANVENVVLPIVHNPTKLKQRIPSRADVRNHPALQNRHGIEPRIRSGCIDPPQRVQILHRIVQIKLRKDVSAQQRCLLIQKLLHMQKMLRIPNADKELRQRFFTLPKAPQGPFQLRFRVHESRVLDGILQAQGHGGEMLPVPMHDVRGNFAVCGRRVEQPADGISQLIHFISSVHRKNDAVAGAVHANRRQPLPPKDSV